MKNPLQLFTAILLALLCHSASADPFTPKHISSNSVLIHVLQIDTGDGLEEFVAVALIGYCAGDPVNKIDPMGTASVWLGTLWGWRHIPGTAPTLPPAANGDFFGQIDEAGDGWLKYANEKVTAGPLNPVAMAGGMFGADLFTSPDRAAAQATTAAQTSVEMLNPTLKAYRYINEGFSESASVDLQRTPLVGRVIDWSNLSPNASTYQKLKIGDQAGQDILLLLGLRASIQNSGSAAISAPRSRTIDLGNGVTLSDASVPLPINLKNVNPGAQSPVTTQLALPAKQVLALPAPAPQPYVARNTYPDILLSNRPAINPARTAVDHVMSRALGRVLGIPEHELTANSNLHLKLLEQNARKGGYEGALIQIILKDLKSGLSLEQVREVNAPAIQWLMRTFHERPTDPNRFRQLVDPKSLEVEINE